MIILSYGGEKINIIRQERGIYMKNKLELTSNKTFKILTLFFFLALISTVAVFGKFAQGVEDFWQDKGEIGEIIEDALLEGVIDVDNYEIAEGVSDFDKNYFVECYIETGGKMNIEEMLLMSLSLILKLLISW